MRNDGRELEMNSTREDEERRRVLYVPVPMDANLQQRMMHTVFNNFLYIKLPTTIAF